MWKNIEKDSLFLLQKKFQTIAVKGKVTYKKAYSLNLIDSVRFMKALLDPLLMNLLDKIYNAKCKHVKNI